MMVANTESFRSFIELVVTILEGAAAVVIIGAAGKALYRFVRVVSGTAQSEEAKGAAAAPLSVHIEFGRFLLLALDFTIGSDVLKLSITPTLQDVSVAAVVVGIRVVLTLLLQYELSKAREEAPTPDLDEERCRLARSRRSLSVTNPPETESSHMPAQVMTSLSLTAIPW